MSVTFVDNLLKIANLGRQNPMLTRHHLRFGLPKLQK